MIMRTVGQLVILAGVMWGVLAIGATDAAALPRGPGGPPSMTIAAWSDHLATQFIARHAPR